MKRLTSNLVVSLTAVIICIFLHGCADNNPVGPEFEIKEDQTQKTLKRLPLKEPLPVVVPKKQKFRMGYLFDPNNYNSGGFLDSVNTKSIIEGNLKHTRNLQVYVPTVMVIEGQRYLTYNYYTINKDEVILNSGKVISGKLWGTFKIAERNARNITKNSEEKLVSSRTLFEGDFNGKIDLTNAKIVLMGTGKEKYSDHSFGAVEQMKCSNDFSCWSSSIKGTILSLTKTAE